MYQSVTGSLKKSFNQEDKFMRLAVILLRSRFPSLRTVSVCTDRVRGVATHRSYVYTLQSLFSHSEYSSVCQASLYGYPGPSPVRASECYNSRGIYNRYSISVRADGHGFMSQSLLAFPKKDWKD